MIAQHLPQLNQYCDEGQVPKVDNKSRVKLIHLESLKMLVWIFFLNKTSIIPAKYKRCWGPALRSSLPKHCLYRERGAGFISVMCTNALINWKPGANKLGKKGFVLAEIASSVLGTHGLVLWKIFPYNIDWGRCVKTTNVPVFLRLLRLFFFFLIQLEFSPIVRISEV